MRLRLLPICLLAAASLVSAAQTTAPNALSAAEREAGWKLLFDGKTLTGWQAYNPARDHTKGWSVEDGALKIADSDDRPANGGGDIVTEARFDDFDFRFEWRVSPGGNSGVKYFVRERSAPGTPMWAGDDGRGAIGHEYQIIDDTSHADAAVGPDRQTGAFYAVVAPDNAVKRLHPVGEFNESRIVVRGGRVEHWLNGAKIVDYQLGTAALFEAVAKSKFKPVPGFGTKLRTRILLQDHGDTVWFRNLKIRGLATQPPGPEGPGLDPSY
jgi:hypothetical protein